MSALQNMFFYLILCTFIANNVLTANLPQHPENIDDLVAKPNSSLDRVSPANTLTLSDNTTSSGNVLKIGCNSKKFGKNLKVQSCRNVFNFMGKDEKQFSFAQRNSGLQVDVPLPLRTLSGKTLAELPTSSIQCPQLACNNLSTRANAKMAGDGLCFVQPLLKEGAIIGHASSQQIGQAAYTMLQACVVERGMGGMAYNIGERSTLIQLRGLKSKFHTTWKPLKWGHGIWILNGFF